MANNICTENLSEPLNGTTMAKVEINAGDGNLTIDPLPGGEPVLATGTLQYLENQGVPTHTLNTSNGQTTITLKGGATGQPWFRLPWAACNGATEWQIHLNPTVAADITAHTDGGNVKLDLTGMAVTHLAADTGGGNLDVLLPDDVADLNVAARTGAGAVTVAVGHGLTGHSTVNASSGAGNVVVAVPPGLAARVHASSGLGKVIVDPRFVELDRETYQSPGYESAANQLEITAHSGAGNVSVGPR
jgi:hypothetical protein